MPRHQELTIERYDELRGELLRRECRVPVLPVLQGYGMSENGPLISTNSPDMGRFDQSEFAVMWKRIR